MQQNHLQACGYSVRNIDGQSRIPNENAGGKKCILISLDLDLGGTRSLSVPLGMPKCHLSPFPNLPLKSSIKFVGFFLFGNMQLPLVTCNLRTVLDADGLSLLNARPPGFQSFTCDFPEATVSHCKWQVQAAQDLHTAGFGAPIPHLESLIFQSSHFA